MIFACKILIRIYVAYIGTKYFNIKYPQIFKSSNFKQIKFSIEELDREIRNHIRESISKFNLKNLAGLKTEFFKRLERYIFIHLLNLMILVETGLDKPDRYIMQNNRNYIIFKEGLFDQCYSGF